VGIAQPIGAGPPLEGAVVELTAYSRTSWATNSGTTASDYQSEVANMFDGSFTTKWLEQKSQSPSPAQWVEVDMGVSQPLAQITLENTTSNNDANGFPYAYSVTVSTDKTSWTQVANGTGTYGTTTINFAQTTARYVKILETGTSGNWWCIDELNISHY